MDCECQLVTFIKRIKNWAIVAVLVILVGAVAILSWLLKAKNKKLIDLENDLQIKSAKLKLENILIKHQITAENLKNIKEVKDEIKAEICGLERQLDTKLAGTMTAEEIVAKLKEVGFP